MTYELIEAQHILECHDHEPEGSYCYDCGEPVDEENWVCILDYDDPLAAVLGKCEICKAPRYEVLGHCPACKGPVYELADHFACYNTFSGACDFRIPNARMEECELEPFYMTMKELLYGGLGTASDGVFTHAILVRADDGGWDIIEADGPLPYYYEKGGRTLIGHSVGCCPACGESVIDLGDRFVCSSVQSSGGCNFSIRKEVIVEAVSSNILDELHDVVIGDDSMIADRMTALLSEGGTIATVWDGVVDGYGYYYEMSLVKEEGGWTFKITRDDAELKAIAEELYERMCSEFH